jgi:succinate dehydrogenase/fumarate reductase flavoprotein subunit
MCCGMPPDVYDVVVLGNGGAAFAVAFAARERRWRVAVVLSGAPPERRLLEALACFEITIVGGSVRRDEDEHYLDVDGRLLYGAQVIDATERRGPADDALEALTDVNLATRL